MECLNSAWGQSETNDDLKTIGASMARAAALKLTRDETMGLLTRPVNNLEVSHSSSNSEQVYIQHL